MPKSRRAWIWGVFGAFWAFALVFAWSIAVAVGNSAGPGINSRGKTNVVELARVVLSGVGNPDTYSIVYPELVGVARVSLALLVLSLVALVIVGILNSRAVAIERA